MEPRTIALLAGTVTAFAAGFLTGHTLKIPHRLWCRACWRRLLTHLSRRRERDETIRL